MRENRLLVLPALEVWGSSHVYKYCQCFSDPLISPFPPSAIARQLPLLLRPCSAPGQAPLLSGMSLVRCELQKRAIPCALEEAARKGDHGRTVVPPHVELPSVLSGALPHCPFRSKAPFAGGYSWGSGSNNTSERKQHPSFSVGAPLLISLCLDQVD